MKNTKQLMVNLTILLIVFVAVMLAFVFTACDNGNGTTDPCASGHTFPEWTSPTCTVDGNSTRTCTKCTQTDTRATGYTKLGCEGTDVIPATCIAVGFSGTGDCIRCGEHVTGTEISIDPNNHLWIDNWQKKTDATCTSPQKDERECNREGCTVKQEQDSTTKLALEHDFDWEEKSFGLEIETCQNAGCEETSGDIRLTLALGDTGPAGGKIIYRLETGFTMTDDDSTAYYLEAAPANMATTLNWSTLTWEEYEASGYNDSLWIDIPGTGTAIGTGRKNTALILSLDPTAPAALACKDYFVEGYESFDDWFLPSRDELNQLYLRRADFSITGYFWSSSQNSSSTALLMSFDNNYQTNYGKIDVEGANPNVRAVRAF